MQTNTLQRNTSRTFSRQVGRGGKRGKTSGRGTKGQKARAGRKIRPEFRDVIKRLPKLRGRGKNSNKTIETKPTVINVETLEKHFLADEKVTVSTLLAKGIVVTGSGVSPKVKILGSGELTKKLSIEGCLVSVGARMKIEKVGGIVIA